MCRARTRSRARRRSPSCRRTKARSGPAPRRWRPMPRRRPSCTAIPTATPSGCARRSAGTTASTPSASSAARAPTSCSNLLVRAYCGPGDELLYSQFGFLMYPINALGVGATPVAAPEKDYRCRRRRHAGQGHQQDPRRLPRQPQQPDRQLHHQGRRAAPARRPAEERAAGDRRGLCRICQPQRLRIGRRAGRPGRERGDDPHLLEDLRPGRRCGSAGCTARPASSTS